MFVLARFDDVRDALANWQVFSSAHGVTLNDQMNTALRDGLLCSDPPRHDVLRKIIERPLTPRAMSELRERITAEAESHVERLVARGSFDAATDLAHHLPVTIVSELVGLPDEGRERMLDWAPANFDCFGPMNERTQTAFKIVGEMVEYAFTQCVPGKLKPGGWAAMIWEAADRGEIAKETCPFLMNDYMGPSLDTTIFATANAIWLFAQHPDQWDLIRQNPALIPQAINEIVRIETPIQGFSRYVAQDTTVGGVALPQGSRAIVLYASANRDERKWGDPDTSTSCATLPPNTSPSASASTPASAITWRASKCARSSRRSRSASGASSWAPPSAASTTFCAAFQVRGDGALTCRPALTIASCRGATCGRPSRRRRQPGWPQGPRLHATSENCGLATAAAGRCPAAIIFHRATSSCIRATSNSGVFASLMLKPKPATRCRSSGSFSALSTSRLSRVTTSAGMPVGPVSANQPSMTRPG